MTIKDIGNWVPINEKISSNIFYVNRINDDFDGLEIELVSEDKLKFVKIHFENNVFTYRSIEESYNLNMINMLADKYGETFFRNNKILYKIEDAEFVELFCENAGGIIDKSELYHFAIITSDYFIDIISDYVPTISFGNE